LELLLNLCWLLLIGPGIYLWLRQRRHAKPLLQFSISLVCLLFLLFPVISATDDLHAMRAEMEESSSSKRPQKQVAKRAPGQDFSAPPAQLPSPVRVLPSNLIRGHVRVLVAAAVVAAGATIPVSRPPPDFFLA
jgi:HAMP domain-containing protein